MLSVSSYRPSQEIKPGMIELMKPKFTFVQSEIQDGDVICFQVDLSDTEYVILTFDTVTGSTMHAQNSRFGEPGTLLEPDSVLRLLAESSDDHFQTQIRGP
jgi:hypothetical protein